MERRDLQRLLTAGSKKSAKLIVVLICFKIRCINFKMNAEWRRLVPAFISKRYNWTAEELGFDFWWRQGFSF